MFRTIPYNTEEKKSTNYDEEIDVINKELNQLSSRIESHKKKTSHGCIVYFVSMFMLIFFLNYFNVYSRSERNSGETFFILIAPFFITILYYILTWELPAVTNKRKFKLKSAEKEKLLKKQSDEILKREKEEDKKFDKVINCPLCLGEGNCIISYAEATINPAQRFFEITKKVAEKSETHLLKMNDEYINTHGETTSLYANLETCPGCDGEGIAYAHFTYGNKITCENCNGRGNLEKVFSRKLDIGNKKEIIKETCEICNGNGINIVDFVSVQLLKKPLLGIYKMAEGEIWNEKDIREKNWRMKIIIDDSTKKFFSLTKPRN